MGEHVESDFTCVVDGRTVPGALWEPVWATDGQPVPLVLVGHGGSGHKRQDYVSAIARGLARHHGIAAAAIDGPIHGERRSPGADGIAPVVDISAGEFGALWNAEDVTDHMNADWSGALDHLLATGRYDADRVGYWGLSMGTMFGLPFVAADPRVKAAVLGLMGTHRSRLGGRLAIDARRIKDIPVMFLVQWDDELIPRAEAIDLFDRIATKDKRMSAHPGRHVEIPIDVMHTTTSFLASRLG
jgi:dienelactone hydrolase